MDSSSSSTRHSGHNAPFEGDPQRDAATDKLTLGVLRHLHAIQHAIDTSSLHVPGIKTRIGLDTAVKQIPMAGIATRTTIGLFLIGSALKHHAPVLMVVRMALNLLVESTVRAVPVVGWLWTPVHANNRNMAMLQDWLGPAYADQTASDSDSSSGKEKGHHRRKKRKGPMKRAVRGIVLGLLAVGLLAMPLVVGTGTAIVVVLWLLQQLGALGLPWQ